MMKPRKKATRKKDTSIDVNIAVLGAKLVTVTLAVGATVEEALVAGEISTDVEVKCNGKVVELGDECESGDRLVIADKVKGGL